MVWLTTRLAGLCFGLLLLSLLATGCGSVGGSGQNTISGSSRSASAAHAPLPNDAALPGGHAQTPAAGAPSATDDSESLVKGTVLRSSSGGIAAD